MATDECDDNNVENLLSEFNGLLFDNELDNDNRSKEESSSKQIVTGTVYKYSRKPKWWYQQYAGGNTRGTKAQRKARTRLAEQYCVPPIRFNSQIDIPNIFNLMDKNKATSSCREKELWIELGFGDGQVLRANAENHSKDRLFIGADVHLPGVGNVLMDMEQHDNVTKNNVFSGYKYKNNVRVYPGDGIKLIQALPDRSCDSIIMTFPDPMCNDPKWRIIQDPAIDLFERKLKLNYGRFILATDSQPFADWTLELFQRRILASQDHGNSTFNYWRWEQEDAPPREDWLPIESKYEKKGLDEGRCTMSFCWRLCLS